MYSSYTAASFARKHDLAEKHGVNLEGALTWAFEFEDQPYFAGFRSLASNGHAEVDVAAVIKVLHANVDKAHRLIERLAREFPRQHPACPNGSDRALDVAIITPPDARDAVLMAKLDAVAGRVLGGKR